MVDNTGRIRFNNAQHAVQPVTGRIQSPNTTGKAAEINLFRRKNTDTFPIPEDREYSDSNPSQMPEKQLAQTIIFSIPRGIVGQS